MTQEHTAQGVGELLYCIAPVELRVRSIKLAENEVGDLYQEIVSTWDVAVERGRPSAQLVCQPSHGQFTETTLVDNSERRLADLLDAQAATATKESLQVAIPPPPG
jgi:hypothetical protein